MNKLTTELLRQLKSAAQEEIMCREASDTSDAWQDLASPENVLALLEIALPVLEQEEGFTELSEISPYDVQHTMPESLAGLISEEIGITFDEDDAQAIWNVCRLEMMKVRQPSTTPQIDNDGWIEWKGGTCPLSYKDNVQVVFRNGETSTRHAVMYGWDVYGSDYDIIAYRVIENDGREG